MKEQDESFVVDFVGGAVGHRFRSGEGRGQALPKAAGFVVGDIRIGGRPIRYGGQLAEHVTVMAGGVAGRRA